MQIRFNVFSLIGAGSSWYVYHVCLYRTKYSVKKIARLGKAEKHPQKLQFFLNTPKFS